MAHFYVKNSLNYNKAVKINVSFIRGYDVAANDGDPITFLELATTYKNVVGEVIKPVYINKTGSYEELDSIMANAVSEIAKQVDWSLLLEDVDPPRVSEYWPVGDTVSIGSNIFVAIKEDASLAAGIDLSELEVTLDVGTAEFNITAECEIKGTPLEYTVQWSPPKRVYKHYYEE